MTSSASSGDPAGPHARPSVVALGGGHGLAAALTAARTYAGAITAVVTVADDGGSSGRLRRERGLPPPGDIRRCLVALAAEGSPWAPVMEHRFRGGTLDGHALGNLVIAALTETLGDFADAVQETARLLGAAGVVVPATTEPVVLKAEVEGRAIEGQVAVAQSPGRIGRVGIVPAGARAPGQAVQAIVDADQVILAPGSLFTSLLPVVCVEEIGHSVRSTPARVVQVCNLAPQVPETEGLTGADHCRAVVEHGGRVDVFLYDPAGALAVDEQEVCGAGANPGAASLTVDGLTHEPKLLGAALASLTGRSAEPSEAGY
ncbi:MAG: YvcK family protein [Actinobacteria bacterium]|nr:YvcK family protein [Actinomycetota bacterium]